MNKEIFYKKQTEKRKERRENLRRIVKEAEEKGNLNLITEREREILTSHLIDSSKSFAQLGRQYCVTRHATYNIENSAIERLKLLNSLGDITSLALSKDAFIFLARSGRGLDSIDKLEEMTLGDLMSLRGIGPERATEIKEKIEIYRKQQAERNLQET